MTSSSSSSSSSTSVPEKRRKRSKTIHSLRLYDQNDNETVVFFKPSLTPNGGDILQDTRNLVFKVSLHENLNSYDYVVKVTTDLERDLQDKLEQNKDIQTCYEINGTGGIASLAKKDGVIFKSVQKNELESAFGTKYSKTFHVDKENRVSVKVSEMIYSYSIRSGKRKKTTQLPRCVNIIKSNIKISNVDWKSEQNQLINYGRTFFHDFDNSVVKI